MRYLGAAGDEASLAAEEVARCDLGGPLAALGAGSPSPCYALEASPRRNHIARHRCHRRCHYQAKVARSSGNAPGQQAPEWRGWCGCRGQGIDCQETPRAWAAVPWATAAHPRTRPRRQAEHWSRCGARAVAAMHAASGPRAQPLVARSLRSEAPEQPGCEPRAPE